MDVSIEEFRLSGRLLSSKRSLFGLSERNYCSRRDIGIERRFGYGHFPCPIIMEARGWNLQRSVRGELITLHAFCQWS